VLTIRKTSAAQGLYRWRVMENDNDEKLGDPSRTRTCNPRSRNPLLCPVELWDRFASTVTAYAFIPLPI
jgi:hypothetical protein